MNKRMMVRVAVATVLFVSAAVPVLAAFHGSIDYTRRDAPANSAAMISAAAAAGPECGPVYVPKMVRERDGSIVGMAFVVDGDDC